MSADFLDQSIEFLKGVGPKKAAALRSELNIFTYGDMLRYYPFRYLDRTRIHKISEIKGELPFVQLKGRILRTELAGERKAKRFLAYLNDGTGTLELVWFQGHKWMSEKIRPNQEYLVFGKPSLFNHKLNIAHPDVEEITGIQAAPLTGLQAVYNTGEKLKTKGLDSKGIWRLQRTLSGMIQNNIPETLPGELIKRMNLVSREEAFRQIHMPDSAEQAKRAEYRLKFEELYFLQLRLLRMKVKRQKTFQGFVFSKVGELFNDFYNNHLPFPLTNAQKRVVKEIRADMGSGKQMNRLLQGDVGSGKTVVALLCMLIAADNGFQASLMAPTEILATQHFHTLSELLKDIPVRIGLLTGSTKTSERKRIKEELLSGKINFLIGTHALIEDEVQLKQMGLVVVDEQHKFGVAQRAKLWKKSSTYAPHVLVMTATPIPRTLAMTLYGDLDVSVIDEMPPGRKPIRTEHRTESKRLRVFGFMKEQIKAGRQVYIVYPLIEESEKLDLNNLYQGFEAICRDFPPPEYRVSIMHGKMLPANKEIEMQRFLKGETNIMVATTVIEVGVNVPNASVMVIENSERFGLSQLHQLRGRVGRGADQSYCILMSSNKLSADAKVRIETMCRTNDGFEIAETDLRLRGPGDIMGTQQSGDLDLQIADLSRDAQLLQLARNEAMKLLETDPELNLPENACVRQHYMIINRGRTNWSRVS